jgi:hypothetical protein
VENYEVWENISRYRFKFVCIAFICRIFAKWFLLKKENKFLFGVLIICISIQLSENSGTNENFIYYLRYILYMFTPTLYAFSQPLYNVCADFAEHIGIDSSTTVCNSLPKVTKISHFNTIQHPWRPLRSTIPTISSNFSNIFSLLTFNFNL